MATPVAPWRGEVKAMSRDLIRFMQSFFAPTLIECQPAGWCPAADIYRTSDGWLLKLELAGVRPEDIEVEVVGQRLCVRGQRRDSYRTQDARCYHMEIAYSHFERSFELPWDLKQGSITSDYRDGMLHINIRTEKTR
jgi:HSP20 family protein